MHRFVPTHTGGVQTVFVHDGDHKQVGLVRAHLRKEAVAFARGDYADPATTHAWFKAQTSDYGAHATMNM